MMSSIDAKVNYTVPLSIFSGLIGLATIYGVHKMNSNQIENVSHDTLHTIRTFATSPKNKGLNITDNNHSQSIIYKI